MNRYWKRYLSWRNGICTVHNILRPHGGYNQGKWGICPKCLEENRAKNIHRDVQNEAHRNAILEAIDLAERGKLGGERNR